MKKPVNKQAKKASKLAKAENLKKRANKVITVKNAEGDPDTTAEIVIQNKINYEPKVSVIIPVYNVEQYLRECLDSVVNQTLKEIEIICVDDGSTDSSLEILKEYANRDNRITVMKQANLHAGVARNAGLAVARGEYLSFLDSDDFFELNMLEEVVNISQKENSQIVIYQYTNYNNTTKEKEDVRGINKILSDKQICTIKTEDKKDCLFSLCNPMPWNKLFKRDFIIDENLFFQSLTASNDIYFSLLAMATSKKISFYYKSLVCYRHNRSDSLRNTRDKNPFNFYEAYKGVYGILEKKNIFNVFKETFLTSLISTCLWTLEHTEKRYTDVKKLICETIVPEFGILTVNKNLIANYWSKRINKLSGPSLIVSLTSYPGRIGTVNQTIESLLNQSIKADKVILWLAPEQFPNKEKDLPKQLLDLCDKGLTIDWYHDIKSYKKLIPTLKKYPDAIIVTADDDVVYNEDWLDKLYQSHLENPNIIHCHRARKIEMQNKKILPYKNWKLCDAKGLMSFSTFFTGIGGVLYPPHCFHSDILNEKKFIELCPKADDIWFWTMALLNNTKINVIKHSYSNPKVIEGTQENALWLDNLQNNENDIQLNKVLNTYPKITEKLIKENKRQKIVKYKQLFFSSYLLFPYYLFKLYKLRKKNEKLQIKKVLPSLSPMRVDIKNEGTEENAVIITSENTKINKPAWFKNKQGEGAIIETNETKAKFKIKAINEGELTFVFRASDKRYNGERFAVWVDYKSIKIDGREILSTPIETWHDKPFRYSMPIKDGQEIFVEIEQQHHKYTNDEFKKVITSINEINDLIKNRENIINKLYLTYCFSNIQVNKVMQSLPNINANVFISLGSACKPAYWLKKHNLRKVALPFDWMMSYPLNTVLKTIKNDCSNWFDSYDERYAQKYANRCVIDTSNNITSIHHFSKTKSVKEQLPSFKETFKRRGKRLQELLKTNDNICFLCNRSESILELKNFLVELEKLYPNIHFTLINVLHSETKKVEKYIISKKSTVYFVYDYDIHEKGGTPENPSFWIGNEKLWNGICYNLSLSKVFNNKNDVNRKYAINLLNNNVNEQTSDDDKFYISEKIFDIKNIKILSQEETINKIKNDKVSIARFGDGELRWMLDPNFQGGFQKCDAFLSKRLKEVFLQKNDTILVCMDSHWKNGVQLSEYYKKVVYATKYDFVNFCNFDTRFGDTGITRHARNIPLMKEIWKDKDVIIVEGEYSRLGVGNDLFDNVKSIKRILCPAKNAFDKYYKILKECKKQPKDKLFLIALGPTATVLAYDLAKLGYWALDVGHIDVVYEWALRGGGKVKIPGKYVNEVKDGAINIEDCTDENYLNSIIVNIAKLEPQKWPSRVFSIRDYGEKVVYRILGFKLSLKKQKLKFLYDKVKTDTYTKTYICGICVKKKPANVFNFIDSRVCNLSNQLSREINKQTQLIENKLKLIENKQIDLANNIKKEIDNIASLQNNLEAKVKEDVLSVSEANLFELNKINEEISANKEKLVALEDLIIGASQQINDAINSTEGFLADKIINLEEKTNGHVLSFDSKVADLQNNLSKQISDTQNVVGGCLDDNTLYFSKFEIQTREERGLCDMVSAPNFNERLKKLISGLPQDSVDTVLNIIRRLQLIKGANSKLNIFTPFERGKLKELKDFYQKKTKISENEYRLGTYVLPEDHFEPSVFFYKHGIDTLNSLENIKNKAILDVGAFIGDSALMLSPLTTDKVYSFEAVKSNYDKLLATIKLNNLNNVVAVNSAVGDVNGEIEITCQGSCSSADKQMVVNPEYTEKCKLIKLDDYVKENNINVGLIKVDIEGAEQSFLRGAVNTIKTQKPTLLISIYHNVDDFLDIKPMIESWNLGYKFKVFKPIINTVSSETLLICEQ